MHRFFQLEDGVYDPSCNHYLKRPMQLGEKIKEDFILHSDGVKSEHGFVSIIPNDNNGFYVTWLDGRNTWPI